MKLFNPVMQKVILYNLQRHFRSFQLVSEDVQTVNHAPSG